MTLEANSNDQIRGQISSSSEVSNQPVTVYADYNFNLSSDIAAFNSSLANADSQNSYSVSNPESVLFSEAFSMLSAPFSQIDAEAAELTTIADEIAQSDTDLKPGDIVMLTARSHEFLFHSQLTANIANRAADGLQQLFRQQG